MNRFSIFALIAVSLPVLLPAVGNLPVFAERGSGRIAFTCPTGEGCTIEIPNPPQSGPKPMLMAAFVPDPTDPPKGNPEGTGTR